MAAVKTAWPQFPYKGLGPYDEGDVLLFSCRDQSIRRCAKLLADGETRLLILTGDTGCGKSSFLLAGLIPYLERESWGFRVLPNTEDRPDEVGPTGTTMFLRCGQAPMNNLANTIYDFVRRAKSVPIERDEKDDSLDLSDALLGCETKRQFATKVGSDPKLLVDSIAKITSQMPVTLLLIIDQAEEVITLNVEEFNPTSAYRNDNIKPFFDFLKIFYDEKLDFNILISIRADKYSHFDALLQLIAPKRRLIPQFFLPVLAYDELIRVIRGPTEGADKSVDTPFAKYRFRYDEGVPEYIVDSLLKRRALGGILPVLQVVCRSLYLGVVRGQKKTLITEQDVKDQKGIEAPIREYLEAALAVAFGRQRSTQTEFILERNKWFRALSNLVLISPNGTTTTSVESIKDLIAWATGEGVNANPEIVLKTLAQPAVRILRPGSKIGWEGDLIPSYSLGHDAIALSLEDWRRVQAAEHVELKSAEYRGRLQEERATKFRRWSMYGAIGAVFLMLVQFGSLSFYQHQTDKQAIDARLRVRIETLESQHSYNRAILFAVERVRRSEGILGLVSDPDLPKKWLVDILQKRATWAGVLGDVDPYSKLAKVLENSAEWGGTIISDSGFGNTIDCLDARSLPSFGAFCTGNEVIGFSIEGTRLVIKARWRFVSQVRALAVDKQNNDVIAITRDGGVFRAALSVAEPEKLLTLENVKTLELSKFRSLPARSSGDKFFDADIDPAGRWLIQTTANAAVQIRSIDSTQEFQDLRGQQNGDVLRVFHGGRANVFFALRALRSAQGAGDANQSDNARMTDDLILERWDAASHTLTGKFSGVLASRLMPFSIDVDEISDTVALLENSDGGDSRVLVWRGGEEEPTRYPIKLPGRDGRTGTAVSEDRVRIYGIGLDSSLSNLLVALSTGHVYEVPLGRASSTIYEKLLFDTFHLVYAVRRVGNFILVAGELANEELKGPPRDALTLIRVSGATDERVGDLTRNAEKLVVRACNRVTENFSVAEWKINFGEEPYRETCPGKPKP
ncbi:MAG: hypothetical protein HYR63_22070 [Proteobacteria bacterium]|nr:hypothetical protein [Pseudomonadota bacterium]